MGGDGEKSRDALAGSSTVGLLHNKVDKMIRLMVETSENQKKMNKTLGELLKSGFHKPETPSTCETLHCTVSKSLYTRRAIPKYFIKNMSKNKLQLEGIFIQTKVDISETQL